STSKFYFDAVLVNLQVAMRGRFELLPPQYAWQVGWLGRINIDDVAWTGEYRLGTGPADDWSSCDTTSMTEAITTAYPDRAICVKALNG
ncbi:MAG: hypothetical protein ACRD9W_17855, partial [Terriglobia bacterium]